MKKFIFKVGYNFIYFLFVVWSWIGLLRKKKWHPDMRMRLGDLPKSIKAKQGDKTIWIHAVSVGEIQVIIPILETLNRYNPKPHVVLSTVTKTGYELACEKLGRLCVVIFAPLDFSGVVKKYIDTISPWLFISAETELWPNLMRGLYKRNVPIVQINGRISDGAFGGYLKVKGIVAHILRTVRLFCVQSDIDAERLMKLGADPQRIHVVGNLKFDLEEKPVNLTMEDLGFLREQTLWIAGSTHKGEEEIILKIFKSLKEEYPEMCLLLAPRHVERSDEIVQLVKEEGLKTVKFSALSDGPKNPQAVVVLDTVGQLRGLYKLASLVFVGKSFPPGGGQNIIEPAYYGKPILTGPMVQNFRDVARIFHDEGAFIQVQNPKELEEKMKALLVDQHQMRDLGTKARGVVNKYRGTKEKTWNLLRPILDEVLSRHT